MILHDKQKHIIASPSRYKIIRAGRRSGKTTLTVEQMCFDAVSQRDRPLFYLAPTQIQARDIVWELFKKRLNGIAEFNEQRLEIKVPTVDKGYSMIKLAGWENRENFRGKPAYKIVFDEVDTCKDFFTGWQEIFRPSLIDFGGGAIFIGTPKKENPNLRRLEKIAETDKDYNCFHFTSNDNPFLPDTEKEKAKTELDHNTYRQEILAEYVDNVGSLFKYDAVVDIFTNTITKDGNKYLIVDVADDGTDKTVFSFWDGLEETRREEYASLHTESIISKIREVASLERIPYSNIAVDAIGVGAGVASSSLLEGIVGFKSSFAPFKTDKDIVRLPYVHYLKDAPLTADFKNLRSQCIFRLADLVNNHKVASRVSGDFKSRIIEELPTYQDVSTGDGKRMATPKEDVKAIIGHSPDHSDTLIMRMYFEIARGLSPQHSEQFTKALEFQREHFSAVRNRQDLNSSK